MNILIISGIFYPEQTPRTYRTSELAIQFAKLGHKVKIIVPGGDYDFQEYSKNNNITVQTYKPVNYQKRFSRIPLVQKVVSRLSNILFNYPHITIINHLKEVLLKENKDYDLLVTIAAPHSVHWTLGLMYRNGIRFAKTWIADCGDPFMKNATEKIKPPFYFGWLEKLWCRSCDFITVPTDTSFQGYYPEFKNKIRVIPQAFNFDEVVLNFYVKHDVPTFAFSGVFIPGRRDPRPLLDYLLSTGKDFKAIFYTKQNSLFDAYKENFDKIELRSYIPRLDLLRELSTMDFLLNLENGTSVQTPSKLIDYALTKRPILSINSQSIDKNVVDEFLAGNYGSQKAVENIDRFNIINVANQFINLVK